MTNENAPPFAEIDGLDQDGPECETCGKVSCPDADLPEFSEPRQRAYVPIYRALHDVRDCDYGCARDYTNAAVRLYVVEAVERIVTERERAARADALRDAAADIEMALDHNPETVKQTDVIWYLRRRAERTTSSGSTEGGEQA